MQYSTVDSKNVNLGDRIDAEYFQPSYLRLEQTLEKKQVFPLRKYAHLVSSAFYPAATQLYEVGDVPFIRCVDCITFPVISLEQSQSFERIPRDFVDKYRNIQTLKEGEIVITKVGTPCYASIISGISEVALSRTVLGVKKIAGIDPFYLTAFLRSKYGFQQLYRERELTIQYQLTLDRVYKVLVFKPEKEAFEGLIAKVFRISQERIVEARALNRKAEELLLDQLGLLGWRLEHSLSFVKYYLDAKKAGRLDAEYFQPRYEEIVRAIRACKTGYEKLGTLVTARKSVEVGSAEYIDAGVPFVRVSNLSPFGISEEKYIATELYEQLREYQPQKGEILLSKDASPGIAYHLKDEPRKMIVSGGILRLTPKATNVVNPEYLTLVLNSMVVQEQIRRDVGGSVILHWRPDQVDATLIPILNERTRDEICDIVRKSLDLRAQSRALIDAAVRAIEAAIEQDEEAAAERLKGEALRVGGIDVVGDRT